MELDLSLASSFLVLAEEGHYGRAAARLHVTSPALTKRIQRLERQLGVVLLQRTPTGILRMTAAGLRFAEAAGPLLAHAEAARQAARQGPSRYTVRIGIPAGARPSLARIGLAKITHDLHRSYPEAHFTCRDIPFPELNECLDDKTVDVLWTSAPVPNATVDSHPLNVDTALVGVVGARHRWPKPGRSMSARSAMSRCCSTQRSARSGWARSGSPTSVPGVTHAWSKPMHQMLSTRFWVW